MLDKESLLKNNQLFEENFNSLKDNLIFGGLTLHDWCQNFSFEISEDLDFKDIITLLAKADELKVIAHNNCIITQGVCKFAKRALEKKKTVEYIKLVADKSERRTSAAIENEVDYKVVNEADRFIVSEYIYEFWREQIKLLEDRSKTLESVFWALKNQVEHN